MVQLSLVGCGVVAARVAIAVGIAAAVGSLGCTELAKQCGADAGGENPAAGNLVDNPGFENGTWRPWTDWGGWSLSSSNVHSGACAVKLAGPTGGWLAVNGIVAGNDYTISAWGQAVSGQRSAIQYRFLDSTGHDLTADSPLPVFGTSYTNASTQVTAPANAAGIWMLVWNAGSDLYLDDVSVVQVDGGPSESCGDGTCNTGETCATCAQDCGACDPCKGVTTCSMTSDGCCPTGCTSADDADCASPPRTGKRWFPGHYLQCTDAVNRDGMAMSKRALVASNPNFAGYQVSIWWGQTETAQDDYSALYAQLDAMRAAAQADGKKVWVRLMERSFHGHARPAPFPGYLTSAQWYYDNAGGENILAPKLWLPAVKERFIRWAEKVAEYCAAHEEFVLISSEEYSIQGAWRQPDYNAQAFDDLWAEFAQRMMAKAGPCLVHVNTGWSTVWPPDYATDKVDADLLVHTHRVGLGPTDLRKDSTSGSATLSTNFGSFMFNPTDDPSKPGYRGVAFFAINYEWGDYKSVESPSEHLRWGVDDLGCHYFAWDPDPGPGSGLTWSWSDALGAVNDANGRTNTAKPSTVSSFDP